MRGAGGRRASLQRDSTAILSDSPAVEPVLLAHLHFHLLSTYCVLVPAIDPGDAASRCPPGAAAQAENGQQGHRG